MEKNKVTSNDVLEALSMRVNEVLRPAKKDNKKNNAYFWIFKFLLLIIYIILINWIFEEVRGLGVSIIYLFGVSLRSVLSSIWIVVIGFMKELIILYLLYDHLKIFISSNYYECLYESDKKMKKKKESFFKAVDVFFKIVAGFFLFIVGIFSAVSLLSFIYMIVMLVNGTYLISPLIIALSIFVMCYFTFKFIQNKFYGGKAVITKHHFIVTTLVLILGIAFFGYETSSFEYKNTLPKDFEIIKKEKVFTLEEGQKIKLENVSKLNNMKILTDNELENEIKVVVEYYHTANVKYTYTFNEDDDLKLTFSSSLNFAPDDFEYVLKLFVETFNSKTMYNYNMFKYPNIYVYANSDDIERIKVE